MPGLLNKLAPYFTKKKERGHPYKTMIFAIIRLLKRKITAHANR
jgi:hypothetical protein